MVGGDLKIIGFTISLLKDDESPKDLPLFSRLTQIKKLETEIKRRRNGLQ
jgi:hypothetical protein